MHHTQPPIREVAGAVRVAMTSRTIFVSEGITRAWEKARGVGEAVRGEP